MEAVEKKSGGNHPALAEIIAKKHLGKQPYQFGTIGAKEQSMCFWSTACSLVAQVEVSLHYIHTEKIKLILWKKFL